MRARARNFFVPRESDIQSAVLEHWKTLGRPMTLVAAIPNAGAMGQPGLTCGLPDLLVMGPDIPGDIRSALSSSSATTSARPTRNSSSRCCAPSSAFNA